MARNFKELQAGMANKPHFSAAVKSDGSLEMEIYEDIGYNSWTGEGISAKTVKQQLNDAGVYSCISLRINSPGGDAFEGVAIGNLLKSTGKPISVSVDGIAASAASIIAMCGDTITMAPNAMMMIHRAWTIGAGNTNDFTKLAATLNKVDSAIGKTYSDKTGKSQDDIMAMMDAETWMSAEDCVKEGFATDITSEDNPAAMAMARNFKLLGHCKTVPVSLVREVLDGSAVMDSGNEMACECSCKNCMDGDCANCTNGDCADKNCEDCPMQAGAGNAADTAAPIESNLSLYEARMAMLGR